MANSHDNEKCIAKVSLIFSTNIRIVNFQSAIGGKFHSELQGEISDAIVCAIAEKVANN